MKGLEKDFTYHAPKGNQPERYAVLRNQGRVFAEFIEAEVPESREKSLAFTKLEKIS